MTELYGNIAFFSFAYPEPPVIKVHEEYLLYDMVAMISAIGGTMGLCIGISFYNISGILLKRIEIGINCNLKTSNEGDIKAILTKTNRIAPEHMSKLDQMKEELYKKLYDDLRKDFLNDLGDLENEIRILKKCLKKQ